MLSPDEIEVLAERARPVTEALNTTIINKIIERLIARYERGEGFYLTRTDTLQASVMEDSGELLKDIAREIEKTRLATYKVIYEAFKDGFKDSWEYDSRMYQMGGKEPRKPSERYLEILQRNYEKTSGEFLNMTGTAALDSSKLYRQTWDKAYFQSMTGAVSVQESFKDSIKELAGKQMEIVHYPSGHKDTLETAALRAIRTGIAQTAGDIAIKRMEEMGWDVVLVSAHFGARPTHEKWQGKFYSLHGNTPGLPDFISSTGYGTVTGLCGANCRHHFGVGVLGINPYEALNINTEESNKRYEETQKQRAYERDIRRSKAECINLKTALNACKTQEDKDLIYPSYVSAAKRLKAKNARLEAYIKEHDLKPYPDRVYVQGWDRSQAASASAAARK